MRAKFSLPCCILLPLFFILGCWGYLTLNQHRLGIFDYAIYYQSLVELSTFKSFNPYITLRDVFIFADHFDPILIVVAPLVRLLNYHPLAPFLIELSFVFSALWLVIALNPQLSSTHKLAAVVIILFSKPVLMALQFPVHPSTWTAPLLILISYFISKLNTRGVYTASLGLMLFKEVFALGIVGLSFYYLYRKRTGAFILFFLTGAFFIFFELYLRKLLVGPTLDYSLELRYLIFNDPLALASQLFSAFFSAPFWFVYAPFCLTFLWALKSQIERNNEVLLATLFFITPLLFIHLLAGKLDHHYALIFGVKLFGAYLFSGLLENLWNRHNRSVYIVAFSFLIFSLPQLTVFAHTFRLRVSQLDTFAPEIQTSRDQLLKQYEQWHSQEHLTWTTSSLSIHLIKPERQLFEINSSRIHDFYDIIFLERSSELFTTWPLTGEQIRDIIERCTPYAEDIIENQYFFLAKGKFPSTCVYSVPYSKR
jgi:hypothetical protein